MALRLNGSGSGYVELQAATNAADNTIVLPDGELVGTDASGNLNITGDFDVDSGTLHVDADNNRVGVGTNAPTYNLDVESSGDTVIRARSSTTANPSFILSEDNNTKWQIQSVNNSDNRLRIINQTSTDAVTIEQNGNVGIGTSSPGYELHVHDSGTGTVDSRIQLTNGDTGTGSGDGFHIIANGSTDNYAVNLLNRENGNLALWTNNQRRLTVDGSGNVGINVTPAGSAKLQVNGSFRIAGSGSASDSASPLLYRISGQDTLAISTSSTERVRVYNTGYVSIGSGYLASNNRHRINGINDTQGDLVLTVSGYQISGGSTADSAEFFSVNYTSSAPSTAATALKVYRNTSTNRSINANGSINASGADYAEYMLKAGDFTIAKGDVCGVNTEGKLTNVFADAIGFVVKSTDPSYVGGDIWHKDLGEAPGGYDDDRTEEEIAAAKIVYEQELEAARQMVDRIAFSGQVPVNVTGTTPGQYIVPAETADGGIEGVAKNEADLTLADYMCAVGKVIAIEDDGRARIIVKVA